SCFPCFYISTLSLLFLFNATSTSSIYTLSLHDALPIWEPESEEVMKKIATNRIAITERTAPSGSCSRALNRASSATTPPSGTSRSEEHTSELQSRFDLVCRLLLEKKK